MKKLILIGILVLGTNNAYGAFCIQTACMAGTVRSLGQLTQAGCASGNEVCYGNSGWSIYDCDRCAAGYEKRTGTGSPPDCNDITYGYCVQSCTGCSNCNNDISWSYHRTGYEKKLSRTCNCNTCSVSSTSYRCAAGYYGSSTNGTTGCTQCPNGGTSAAGATIMTSCYLPTGTRGSDASGSFEYTSNCYYSSGFSN